MTTSTPCMLLSMELGVPLNSFYHIWTLLALCSWMYSFVVLVSLSAAEAPQGPPITVEVIPEDEEELFSISEYSGMSAMSATSSLADTQMLDTAPPAVQKSSQLLLSPTPAPTSGKLLDLPSASAVEDKAESEVIKKGGMAGARARAFVVSTVVS